MSDDERSNHSNDDHSEDREEHDLIPEAEAWLDGHRPDWRKAFLGDDEVFKLEEALHRDFCADVMLCCRCRCVEVPCMSDDWRCEVCEKYYCADCSANKYLNIWPEGTEKHGDLVCNRCVAAQAEEKAEQEQEEQQKKHKLTEDAPEKSKRARHAPLPEIVV